MHVSLLEELLTELREKIIVKLDSVKNLISHNWALHVIVNITNLDQAISVAN